jgi:hypothetical protein
MTEKKESERHLTIDELAARWHMARGSLAGWRHFGKGPKYVKVGRSVLYPLSAVEEFELQNTVTGEPSSLGQK